MTTTSVSIFNKSGKLCKKTWRIAYVAGTGTCERPNIDIVDGEYYKESRGFGVTYTEAYIDARIKIGRDVVVIKNGVIPTGVFDEDIDDPWESLL